MGKKSAKFEQASKNKWAAGEIGHGKSYPFFSQKKGKLVPKQPKALKSAASPKIVHVQAGKKPMGAITAQSMATTLSKADLALKDLIEGIGAVENGTQEIKTAGMKMADLSAIEAKLVDNYLYGCKTWQVQKPFTHEGIMYHPGQMVSFSAALQLAMAGRLETYCLPVAEPDEYNAEELGELMEAESAVWA